MTYGPRDSRDALLLLDKNSRTIKNIGGLQERLKEATGEQFEFLLKERRRLEAKLYRRLKRLAKFSDQALSQRVKTDPFLNEMINSSEYAARQTKGRRTNRVASTRFAGVYRDSDTWTAEINIGNKFCLLGRYEREEDAYEAYKKGMDELHTTGTLSKSLRRRGRKPKFIEDFAALRSSGNIAPPNSSSKSLPPSSSQPYHPPPYLGPGPKFLGPPPQFPPRGAVPPPFNHSGAIPPPMNPNMNPHPPNFPANYPPNSQYYNYLPPPSSSPMPPSSIGFSSISQVPSFSKDSTNPSMRPFNLPTSEQPLTSTRPPSTQLSGPPFQPQSSQFYSQTQPLPSFNPNPNPQYPPYPRHPQHSNASNQHQYSYQSQTQQSPQSQGSQLSQYPRPDQLLPQHPKHSPQQQPNSQNLSLQFQNQTQQLPYEHPQCSQQQSEPQIQCPQQIQNLDHNENIPQHLSPELEPVIQQNQIQELIEEKQTEGIEENGISTN